MTFQQVLDGVEILSQSGNPSVSGIEYDSRRVKPGNLFVAMRGETSDGNRYIDQVLAAGATAIVTDSAHEQPRPGVAWAQVAHGRRALGRLSANFYRHPAERLAITGVTGTNGKSTTAGILRHILDRPGSRAASIGTLGVLFGSEADVVPGGADLTTPGPVELQRVLRELVDRGVKTVAIEV